MELNKQDYKEILENAFSYIVVFAMFAYGIGKMVQFSGTMPTHKTVAKMTGMELMWSFYGYSKPYVITLGILEIIGGILIFTKRTRIIGCLLLSTILINVILQDIFYNVNQGALKAAIIYQTLILVILWFNKDRIITVYKILTNADKVVNARKIFWVKILLSVMLFVILRILEFYLTTKW